MQVCRRFQAAKSITKRELSKNAIESDCQLITALQRADAIRRSHNVTGFEGKKLAHISDQRNILWIMSAVEPCWRCSPFTLRPALYFAGRR